MSIDGGIFTLVTRSITAHRADTRCRLPSVGFASTPDGRGYWLVASRGEVYAFGDAGYYGSLGATQPAQHPDCRHSALLRRPGVLDSAGRGRGNPYGDAPRLGEMGRGHPPVDGIAVTPTARVTGRVR